MLACVMMEPEGEMASLTSGETCCNLLSFSDRQMESVMLNSKY